MNSGRQRMWGWASVVSWALVALLFHAAVLLGVCYWPVRRPADAGPISVVLIEATNPYLDGPDDEAVAALWLDEPLPRPAPPAEPAVVDAPAPPEQAHRPPEAQPPGPPPHPRPEPSEPILGPTIGAAELLTGQPARPAPDAPAPRTAGLVAPQRAFSNRFGQAKQDAMRRFGGSPEAAQAVADALAWLAAHQDENGRWDRVNFSRHCPRHDRCDNPAKSRLDRNGDVAVTALALLAFLGNGHLPGDMGDPYHQTVARAIDWILSQQQANGQFGPLDIVLMFRRDRPLDPVGRKDPLMMYNHTIGTLALAEAYSLTGDARLAEPVLAAVHFLATTQQPEGGWDYFPEPTGRNDASISGWAVMALKAAAAAGLPVPVMTVYRAAQYFWWATEPDGRVRYAESGTGVRIDSRTGLPQYRYGPAMTAVGVFARQLLGYRVSSADVLVGANRLAAEPPNLVAGRGGDPTRLHSEYYWYYGTMAMFQMGGKYWADWNPAIQRVLLTSQDRTVNPNGRAHRYGSWPAYGTRWGEAWGGEGGRLYATALFALTLEVYFRYLPLNEVAADYDYSPVVEQVLAAGNPNDQQAMVRWLGQLRPQLAEPLLYGLVRHQDPNLRFAAAIQLAGYGSPLARPVLNELSNWVGPHARLAAQQALSALGGRAVPDLFGPVRQFDRVRWLVSFESADAYVGYGLPVAVMDGAGMPIARMTVVGHDQAAGLAVGRIVSDDRPNADRIAAGQTVRLHWK